MAVQDGKVLKVGSTDEIKQLAGPATRLVDLGGKTVVPGLIDAHCHPMEAMMMKETWVDCRYPQTPSVKQALDKYRRLGRRRRRKANGSLRPAFPPVRINLPRSACPTKAELDAVAPDNPDDAQQWDSHG